MRVHCYTAATVLLPSFAPASQSQATPEAPIL